MAAAPEKRRPALGIDQAPGSEPGVGGRQPSSPAAPGGGGYPGTRTASNVASIAKFDSDGRLGELRAMGMPAVWMRVAEAIGVDAFLTMWFILDAQPSFNAVQASGEPIRITLRRYSSWLRFQRNRVIESYMAEGLSPREVQERIERELCEHVSIRHITRIGGRP